MMTLGTQSMVESGSRGLGEKRDLKGLIDRGGGKVAKMEKVETYII